jgi:uncharacterized protein (TIGR03083 family)
MDHLDHLDHLATDTSRLVDVLRDVDPAARVPTCPDWTATDLAWHLADVQRAWGRIVAEQLDHRPRASALDRPTGLDDCLDLLCDAHDALQDALTEADPSAPCWSWIAEPTTVAWVQRRMAHEALVHRLDAEQTAGMLAATVDARVALDGIDELFEVYALGVPSWGSFTASGPVVRVQPVGGHEPWTIQLGRVTGTSPTSGTELDLPAGIDASTASPDCTVSGAAAPLHAWSWARGPRDALRLDGDPAAADALDALLRDVT